MHAPSVSYNSRFYYHIHDKHEKSDRLSQMMYYAIPTQTYRKKKVQGANCQIERWTQKVSAWSTSVSQEAWRKSLSLKRRSKCLFIKSQPIKLSSDLKAWVVSIAATRRKKTQTLMCVIATPEGEQTDEWTKGQPSWTLNFVNNLLIRLSCSFQEQDDRSTC